MQRKASPFTVREMAMQTMLANKRVENTLKQAKMFQEDPLIEKRLAAQQCKSCFYNRGLLAGQAFTDRPCACCGEVQTYSSTNTDALCQPCAAKHTLCKHCGGDLHMRQNRTEL